MAVGVDALVELSRKAAVTSLRVVLCLQDCNKYYSIPQLNIHNNKKLVGYAMNEQLQRMTENMQLFGLSQRTLETYSYRVKKLTEYFKGSSKNPLYVC